MRRHITKSREVFNPANWNPKFLRQHWGVRDFLCCLGATLNLADSGFTRDRGLTLTDCFRRPSVFYLGWRRRSRPVQTRSQWNNWLPFVVIGLAVVLLLRFRSAR